MDLQPDSKVFGLNRLLCALKELSSAKVHE